MLPDLIEILPLDHPAPCRITVPGSKSLTNRALILAALGDRTTTLHGALWSEDTQVMTECLERLGFEIEVRLDPAEPCNRIIRVRGMNGKIPAGGTESAPIELFVGNAGTAARFLAALVCLGKGVYRLDGVPRMRERPQAALFQALRELGYRVQPESGRDSLPAVIHGGGPTGRSCRVSIEQSSQFASALLMGAAHGGWKVNVTGENAEESPYVAMTIQLIERMRQSGPDFAIEPDASSGSYFWAAGWLLAEPGSGSRISVADWPDSGWQIDAEFIRFWPLPKTISRRHHLGDSIMTAIVLAPFAPHPVQFTDLGRLRVQECERVKALRTELSRCGAKVMESDDTLTVEPSELHGAEIETYDDHRMAMCFAFLGLKVPGLRLKNPACVKKTFPNFFQKLAAPPPSGLGAVILDARTGSPLFGTDLLACGT